MKKAIIKSLFYGALYGSFFGILIPIIFNIDNREGMFMFTPLGNSFYLVLRQWIGSMIIGFVASFTSSIYDNPKRSGLINSLLHMLVMIISVLIIGLWVKWFDLNHLDNLFFVILSFFGIYFVIWIINYLNERSQIEKINKKISDKKESKID